MEGQTSIYEVQRLSYTHDGLIDLLIAHPEWSQGRVAAAFGYTQAWFSRIVRSDMFRERIAERKAEIVDPLILQSLEQRFEAMADQALQVITKRLEDPQCGMDGALKALELSSRALGYGVDRGRGVTVNNNFVAVVPAKSRDADSWVAEHKPQVIDVGPPTNAA